MTRGQTNGALRPDQAQEWWETLQRSDAAGTMLISFTALIVVGHKR